MDKTHEELLFDRAHEAVQSNYRRIPKEHRGDYFLVCHPDTLKVLDSALRARIKIDLFHGAVGRFFRIPGYDHAIYSTWGVPSVDPGSCDGNRRARHSQGD